MTPRSEGGVQAFRARLAGLLLLRNSLIGLAAWGLLYGVVVLALRGATGLEPEALLWGLLSLPLVVAAATVLAFRALPTAAQAKALLDRHGRAGGLLMAGVETDTGKWDAGRVEGPGLRWRAGRTGVAAAVGLSFLVTAFLVPASFARIGTPRLDVRRDTERLEEQLAVLKEEKVIGDQRAKELKEKLDQLRQDALARDPVKTLEALDFLQDTTQRSAQEAAEAAARQIEQLAKAGAMAEALEKNGAKLDQAQMSEAMNQLAGLMRKADAENALSELDLSEEGKKALQEILEAMKKGGPLTKEQMKKLAEALKGAKSELAEKVGKLVKAKLVDADALGKCEKGGECDGAALAAYLKENGSGDAADLLLMVESDEGGKGGVDRGPGHAKLTFGDESSDQGAAFKDEALPPGDLKALRDSELEGISKTSPTVHKGAADKAASGALGGAKAGGGSSTGQMVLPRHRGAVERYFERQPSPKK
ncbi:MAG: hypothetical protein ACRC33_20410 [Gemmataceae bacterium]